MSEATRLWMETTFNIFYLFVVLWLVLTMFSRRSQVADSDRKTARLILWAFFLLALGDMGHVGFRLVAFALGDIGTSVHVFGRQLLLAPMGSLATAVTFTFFYVIMIMVWKERFNKTYGWFCQLLFLIAVIRLLLMTHPANCWNSLEIHEPWSIYRNLPLMLMQLGAAYLILRDGILQKDRTFIWIGILILVSFACYAPVIFLQKQIKFIGMLMIPKTIAYLVIAFLGLFKFYPKKR
ncbi:MAG: hypothetical protein WCQ99_07470 [Pseudomonadota bacterium]